MTWQKGQSGNPLGRPKGRHRPDARHVAEKLIFDEEYLVNLQRRMRAGVIAPAIEQMVWVYFFGRPDEQPPVQEQIDDLSHMTDAELNAALFNKLTDMLEGIPRDLLKDRLRALCARYGMRMVEVKEINGPVNMQLYLGGGDGKD